MGRNGSNDCDEEFEDGAVLMTNLEDEMMKNLDDGDSDEKFTKWKRQL